MDVSAVLLVFAFFLPFWPALIHCDFTLQPVSVNTTLNSTVKFSCEANSTGDRFSLNFLVDFMQADKNAIKKRGFEASTSKTDGVVRGVLTAKASGINNNTNVTCLASSTSESTLPNKSNTVFLMIQGLLDSVVDLDYTFINGSSVLLTWTAPYTLDNVPITGYYIVNGSVNITTTDKNIILSATNPDPCILNNVSVSPINGAGIGSSIPLITPNVSVVLVVDEARRISLNISVYVGELCFGEYPNNVTVIILTTNNEIQDSNSIPTQVNDQLMITGVITVPNNLNTFIVNVSLSNNGGKFLPAASFEYNQMGPVTSIDSSINNCSTIDVFWNPPKINRADLAISHYLLKIYDDINDHLLRSVSVYDTSYQFVDNDLFIHRYTYVITGVNELGEGISNNDTFSYQRVPQSVKNATVVFNKKYTQNTATFDFNIPIIIECTGEAPENATVTIQCNGTVTFDSIYLPPAAEVKPSAAEVKPSAAEVKPSAAEIKPSAAEIKPPAAEIKSPAAEIKPSAAEIKPSAAEIKSPAVEIKSPAVKIKPSAAEIKSPAVKIKSPAVKIKSSPSKSFSSKRPSSKSSSPTKRFSLKRSPATEQESASLLLPSPSAPEKELTSPATEEELTLPKEKKNHKKISLGGITRKLGSTLLEAVHWVRDYASSIM
uniref:Fibronectin type-III domain-containing protein n=1 Tax=Amphimedon queenslandica TaxID=400682 RepID=A0A1X7T849_AMPQE